MNKRAFVMKTKIVGLVLALILLLLALSLVFPKVLNLNEKLHAARCKFVPFGCEVEESDTGSQPDVSDEKDSKSEFEKEFEKARQTSTLPELNSMSKVKGFVENTKCELVWERDEENVYLLKSNTGGSAYSYLHIKDKDTGRSRDDYYVRISNQDPEKLVSGVKSQGYDHQQLIVVDNLISESQKKLLKKDEAAGTLPTLGYISKICRIPEMEKIPKTPDLDYDKYCKIFNDIEKAENNCG